VPRDAVFPAGGMPQSGRKMSGRIGDTGEGFEVLQPLIAVPGAALGTQRRIVGEPEYLHEDGCRAVGQDLLSTTCAMPGTKGKGVRL